MNACLKQSGFPPPLTGACDGPSSSLSGRTSGCFCLLWTVLSALDVYKCSFLKTVRTLDLRPVEFVFILVLENMCNSSHLRERCSSSLKSFHAAFIDPDSVELFSTKRYYSFMKPHLFCVTFSFFPPHILMSGVWFCIFLLVNCLQVQYADTNSSTSISKCNISTYSAESKLYCTV